jgi:hypothetical protein
MSDQHEDAITFTEKPVVHQPLDEQLEFLRVQLDEDEQHQRSSYHDCDEPSWHIADLDDQWEAEIETKRRLIGLALKLNEYDGESAAELLNTLTGPYASRAGWREEWKRG